MERVGRLLCIALVLSLPLVLVAVLVLQVRQAAGSLPATGPRHTIVHGRDHGTQRTHRTYTSSVRNTLLVTIRIAADPALGLIAGWVAELIRAPIVRRLIPKRPKP